MPSGFRTTIEDYRTVGLSRGISYVGDTIPNSTHTPTDGWIDKEGHKLHIRYNDVRRGRGCPHCYGNTPKTLKDYLLVGMPMGIEFTGNEIPKNCQTPVWGWRDKEGHVWSARYSDIQQGYGCLKCAGTLPKTIEDYVTVGASRGVYYLGKEIPKSVTTPIYGWSDDKGHVWRAHYNSIQQGSGCPKCNLKTQHRIFDLIRIIYSDAVWESKVLKNTADTDLRKTQRLDIYIPSLHTAIEYDGEQHFVSREYRGGDKAVARNQAADRKKEARCAELGIRLIRIHYLDYEKDPEGVIAGVLEELESRRLERSKC